MSGSVHIVGRGAVGTALAEAARKAGIDVTHQPGRDLDLKALTGASFVVLAVPDAVLSSLAERLSAVEGPFSLVHVAGARSPEELAPARRGGHAIGAMHPLVSFAAKKAPPSLAQTTFVLGGDSDAIDAASAFARRLGALPLVAPIHGPTYHACAALLANGAAGLAHLATNVLVSTGLERRQAESALAGLLRTVAANLETVGVPAALTGPIRRGDVATVEAHRASVHTAAGERALADYDRVAHVVLHCAEDAGLDVDAAAALSALIDD